MSRLVIDKAEIRDFFEEIHNHSGKSWDEIGRLVKLSGRTIRDWRRGVLLPNKEKIEKFAKLFQKKIPFVLEEREEYWTRKYARKAAQAMLKKYGPPGTPEGRRKGGLISQQLRRKNPEYYRGIGVIVRGRISIPRIGLELAEFIGTVLGDGSLTKDQCSIYFNMKKDKEYADYIEKLIQKLFKYNPYKYTREKYGVLILLTSGRNLIDFLTSKGLKIGNKVKQQVDVPLWIKKNFKFSLKCLRGLMDTDGGIFIHKYKVAGKIYCYKKICFTNKSQPLLDFAFTVLRKIGLTPKYQGEKKVWLYSEKEVIKYLKIIGSSNPRLLKQV